MALLYCCGCPKGGGGCSSRGDARDSPRVPPTASLPAGRTPPSSKATPSVSAPAIPVARRAVFAQPLADSHRAAGIEPHRLQIGRIGRDPQNSFRFLRGPGQARNPPRAPIGGRRAIGVKMFEQNQHEKRVELVKGTFCISSKDGKGTVVKVRVSLLQNET